MKRKLDLKNRLGPPVQLYYKTKVIKLISGIMCSVFYNLVIQFIYLQIFYVVKPVKVNSVSVSGYCIGSEIME